MKKRKVVTMKPFNILDNEDIKISKYQDDFLFDINGKITDDVAEAVAIMIYQNIPSDNNAWSTNIKQVDLFEIDPKRSLYWLSGGDIDWSSNNYRKEWHECVGEFSEKFSETVLEMVQRSNNMFELREKFQKDLNITILYEFALENKIAD